MRVAVDTWAFRESVARTPRGREAEGIIAEADAPFTVRECVVEMFGAMVKAYGRAEPAWRWWEGLRATPMRVFEPPLSEIHEFIRAKGPMGALSLADWSLAYVATRERTRAVLTEDAEFRRVGLDPLFAR